jgi:hypothetical protein
MPKLTQFAFLRTNNGIDDESLDSSDGINKAGSTACWTRMVQPMTRLTLMAQRMALTMAHLTQRVFNSTNSNLLYQFWMNNYLANRLIGFVILETRKFKICALMSFRKVEKRGI